MTNPEVLRTTLQSNGENLVKGLNNLLEDLDSESGQLSIRQSADAFRIGENIATAPGKVVFRNALIELLQFDPTTEKVYEKPLLIFPPWINKFYILDLRPENSFIRWAVAQGYTVFVASWVNPDRKLAQKSFEDYMREGIFAALDAVRRRDRRREDQHHRLLHRRHAAVGHPRLHGGEGRRPGQLRDLLRGPGRFQRSRRSADIHRRRAARSPCARRWSRPAACSKARRWARPSTCCAPTT